MLANLSLLVALVAVSLFAGVLLVLTLRRRSPSAPTTIRVQSVAERIRSVGKIVGLEVHAKEIATSTKGWAWVPPILLSQAKIAMIFHFEKQYFVDLSRLRAADVEPIDAHVDRPRYRVHLPPVEGSLRLTDVSPYDIQAGRVLGLLDVIPMNAETQKQLMQTAQEQAADLFQRAESRYVDAARRSIEQHLEALLRLFEVDIEVAWADQPTPGRERIDLGETVARRLSAGA